MAIRSSHLAGSFCKSNSTRSARVLGLQGSRAVVECHGRGYHLKRGVEGGEEWTVAGHWLVELVEPRGIWQITSMTQKTLHRSGNREPFERAGREEDVSPLPTDTGQPGDA